VVVAENAADAVYFTGLGAVFKIGAAGGTATTVASGPPLVDPSGIAVARDGTIYVLDTVSSDLGRANLLRITGGTASVLMGDLRVGYPAGIALTMDDSKLIVSALGSESDHDEVLVIELGTMAVSMLDTANITNNVESAGLHRAKDRNTFSWADSTAGGKGIVYRVELP
jgi:DNA-binding beta-propeller fold protein YncE